MGPMANVIQARSQTMSRRIGRVEMIAKFVARVACAANTIALFVPCQAGAWSVTEQMRNSRRLNRMFHQATSKQYEVRKKGRLSRMSGVLIRCSP